MIPPGVFIAAVLGALIGACVTLVFDAQYRARAMLWGVVVGVFAGLLTWLVFLR